ncbi:MAG: type III-A CRISPR-associated RAMP protein Csm4 [Candidatus Caenarcaniphilales bacterium]|nr:type III-A CRISPR-associated RAMP protein Csm4 [Candidatus Caenarcaniphilales bacterium]
MQVLIKLDFQGGRLHFGGYDQGLSTDGATPNLLADTFFSAICHGWSCLYGTESLVSDFLEGFISGKPPFLLSDLFPYKGEKVLFPKPKLPFRERRIEKCDEDNTPDKKKLKKISEGFRNAPKNCCDNTPDKKKLKKIPFLSAENLKLFLQGDDLNLNSPEVNTAAIWQIEYYPQVSISREGNPPDPYSVVYLSYAKDAGLWGLIEFRDTSFAPLIRQVIEFLGEESGIGGKRSTGAGRFKLFWQENPSTLDQIFEGWKRINSLSDSQSFQLLLSLTNAKDSQEAAIIKESTYELVTRKGFLYSADPDWGEPVKKRAVCMIQAGSVLSAPIQGRLVDVTPTLKSRTPPHKIYRYGYALTKEVKV